MPIYLRKLSLSEDSLEVCNIMQCYYRMLFIFYIIYIISQTDFFVFKQLNCKDHHSFILTNQPFKQAFLYLLDPLYLLF